MSQETPVSETPLKISSASDYRKKSKEVMIDGTLVKLPSGMVVKLCRPSLAGMIKQGRIPDNLISAAVRQINGDIVTTPKEVLESIKMMDEILMAGFVEPKLVIEVTDPETQISVSELCDEDRTTAYKFIQFGEDMSRGGLTTFR